MSFGVSVSDIITLISLAKDTVQHCRHAPSAFAEASSVSQSLCLMLEAVKTEYQNPDSPLHKDDRTRTDFAIHFMNCERSLKPLAHLIVKHKRLATSNIGIIDRARFPKKDYLEHRGDLAFYTARLSEFLQMVGLGSLGRIEQNIEDIKDGLPILMSKVDQMCAEFRIVGDRESLLSDHTNDEKFVWKTFRRKLNDAGFTSSVLREHEAAIFLRIRELTKCGLLDTDGSSSPWTGEETLSSPPPIYQMPFRSNSKRSSADRDADSQKITLVKPLIKDLRPGKSKDSGRDLQPESSISNPLEQRSNWLKSPAHGTSSFLVHDGASYDDVPQHTGRKSSSGKPRVWRNVKGDVILEGILSTEFSRSGQSFVAVVDSDKQEVLIPQSSLSEVDLAYLSRPIQFPGVENEKAGVRKEELSLKYLAGPKKAADADDSKDEPIDLPPCTHPNILVGKRTRTQMRWAFREERSKLPQTAPFRSRSSLTSDLLPMAASSGDLKRVKNLLASGEHIESKGPQSWTEEPTIFTDWYPGTIPARNRYPETTALYRAAYAGWFEIVHFLIGQGADVNTKDGENGIQGAPILFSVIRNGDNKMARLLLEYEAETKFEGTTALHTACSCPKWALVRLMLDYGAHIDARDSLGQTPLYLASRGGFASIVELLLEEGASPNEIISERRTALYRSRGDVIELLLRYGADPALGHGRFGETKIYNAAWYNEMEVVELLLKFEADVNIRNKKRMESYKGVTEKAFHGPVSGLSKKHAIRNAWGKSALHAAAYRGHEDMVQMLLSAGADLEAVGNDGTTPLHLAERQNHKGVVQILLKAGAQSQTGRPDPALDLLDQRNTKENGFFVAGWLMLLALGLGHQRRLGDHQ